MDTVDANIHIGLPKDAWQYGIAPSILNDMNVGSIDSITNNPRRVDCMIALRVKIFGFILAVVESVLPV